MRRARDGIGGVRRWGWAAALVLGLSVLACHENGTVTVPGPPPVVPTLSTDLHVNCFRWPAGTFTRQTYAQIVTGLEPGDLAVDFTLKDVNGAPHRLADLLAEKPVLLVLGSFT
jgi:hypothetical protein